MAPFFVSNYQVITMRHFLIGFALVCAVGFGGDAFAATYEVTADSIVDIEYSHDSYYKGQAWYKAKDINTGQTRYFRKPVSIPAVPPSRPPLAMIPDAKRVATVGKAGGSLAVKASRLNGIAIAAWLAADAAGFVIDELSGQVTGQAEPYGSEDGFDAGYYWLNTSHETPNQPHPTKEAACLAGNAWASYTWNGSSCLGYGSGGQYFGSVTLYKFACGTHGTHTAAATWCSTGEAYKPAAPVSASEVQSKVIEPALGSNPSQSDLSRVVSDLNAKPYNFEPVKLGAEEVVADLQAEGHTATTPHSSSPTVEDSDYGDRVSILGTGSGEVDPNKPLELPTDYARENTLQGIRDALEFSEVIPQEPTVSMAIPASPETTWDLTNEHSTFWSWLRGTFPFSLLTSPLAAISADTPPAPQFCYTAVGIEKCHSMSMWDPLFSAIRFAEGLLLIFGFYLVMVRAVMRFGG